MLCRPSWQLLLLAFCTGALLASLGMVVALAGTGHSAGHPLLRRGLRVTAENSKPPVSSHPVCTMPTAQGVALAPRALANVTGNGSLVPEHLIVVARKREVQGAAAATGSSLLCRS